MAFPENDAPETVEETAETTAPAPRELNRLEVLRGLRISTWEASFSTVHSALTTGAFLTGFALWLGANSFAMGLVTAIPTFAGLIQIFASYAAERQKTRKPFVAGFAIAGRTLWLPILLLPLVLPTSSALFPFLLLYAISFGLLNVTVPAWMSWMSDLVPPDHRGRYFGRRNMIAGIVGMVIGLPAAWFLDFATRRHHWEAWGFGLLFGLAVIGGFLSFGCLLRQPEPPRAPRAAEAETGGVRNLLAYYRTPLADRNFRHLILFNTIFGLGQNFAAPFFTVYALQNLRLDYVWLQIFATLTSLASLASMPLWGYLSDKVGNKSLLAICVVGVFTVPFAWIATSPQNHTLTLLLLTELNLASGLFWGGAGLTQFNLLINASPSEKTGIYVATMSAITGLTGGIAPLIGGALMRALADWHGQIFGHALLNFHVTFFVAALLRIAALPFLKPVADPNTTSAREVLQQLTRAHPRSWRHIRELQSGSNVEARLRATEALGEARTQLAVSELQAALTDPSLAVREEAARALGEIGDPNAVDALIAALQDPTAGLVDEAAAALGQIGDRRANAALIAILRDDTRVSRRERMVVARALGRLGGSDAVDALLEALRAIGEDAPGDEEIAEAMVDALGQIGSGRATQTLLARLESSQTSRTLRMALVRALGEIGDKAACPALRSLLAHTTDDPLLLPLLADALARLQDTKSALPLLDHLEALDSPVARKQVAHGIGMLMGEGEAVYSLLSREEFARDAALSKLASEMQRATRNTPADAAISAAFAAYTETNYSACLAELRRAYHALPSNPAADVQQTLCRQLLEHATKRASSPPIETVLLVFSALNALLD